MRSFNSHFQEPERMLAQYGRFAAARYSTSHQPPAQVSPHIGFYKTFARPIAKVLLMATLTYQFTYWLWVKLEKDEIKNEREAEIRQLEDKLKSLTASKQS